MTTDINQAIANAYAALPYALMIENDECDGRACVMALNPELEGCMAQGDTVDEAIANLADARLDYIAALLERRLPVPTPGSIGQTRQLAEWQYAADYYAVPNVSATLLTVTMDVQDLWPTGSQSAIIPTVAPVCA